MNKKTPLVSVVMTAYNAADFVGEAVESIQNQTYTHWELIVVNDGSTDATGKVLAKLSKNDKRIILISSRKNQGASIASNLGLARVRGQFIARMDADDISIADRLQKQVDFLQRHSDVIAVGGQCELIDKTGQSIGIKSFAQDHEQIYNNLYQYNPIQHPSLMINTELLGKQKITYHTEVLLAHDLEVLFKLTQYGRLANMPSVVLKYRIRHDSLSLKHPKETFRHTLAVRKMAKKMYGYVPTVKGMIIHNLQKVVMFLLPSFVVYPLFRLIRMRKLVEVRSQLSYGVVMLVGTITR